jgi:hypothetical protein
MNCNKYRINMFVLLMSCILLSAGCGKKRPLNKGEADITALGVGIGSILKQHVQQGDKVLVFGVPNPVGYSDALERAVLKGLEAQLKPFGVRVERALYTVEEGETYGRGQYRLLHPAFAGGVWQRQQNPRPQIVVSLIGWPERDAVFLPETITFVGVSWLHPVSPQSWTRHFEKVIAVHAKNGPVFGRPSRHALKKEAELQQWFDDRFDVDVAGGDV